MRRAGLQITETKEKKMGTVTNNTPFELREHPRLRKNQIPTSTQREYYQVSFHLDTHSLKFKNRTAVKNIMNSANEKHCSTHVPGSRLPRTATIEWSQ